MRIKVTLTPPRYVIDGLHLPDLKVGRVYDLPDLIGQVLVASDAAEIMSDGPAARPESYRRTA